MQRQDNPAPIKGYLTFAQNSETADYLTIAYLQALSIKATQKINNYAVIVDEETMEQVTDEHRAVFDHIILLPEDQARQDEWKLGNEWMAWNLTPFRETVKLDADMLFTRNIDHWWPIMQQKELCITSNVRDYEGNISDSMFYRKLFVKNKMPNLYSGFTYFRFTEFTAQFFNLVKRVFEDWPMYRDKVLVNCRHDKANTDEAYAIAAMIIGEEKCYNPAIDVPTFCHMKGAIQGWSDIDWTEYVYAQLDDSANLTVGFNRQMYPFHYVNKEFATEELIERYKRILESPS